MDDALRLTIKTLLSLHTFIGKVIDVLAIKANNGLHPKHHLMHYSEFFLDHIGPHSTILDIGCGNGFVASQIATKAEKVTGIDTDRANIKQAKEQHARSNIEYILGDATTFDFPERYDAVVLSNVLEHIRDRVTFLNKIRRLSDTLLIRVPMLDRDWLTLYRKSLGMFYFCDSTHFTEYTLASFQDEMKAAGLCIESSTIRFGEIWAVEKPNML
jgi:SAM-dependent methyltransferase